MTQSPFFNDEYNVRGFGGLQFNDKYGHTCRIQKSSSAMYNAIWLGINDADPKIMTSDAKELGMDTQGHSGWMPYPIPKEVLLHTSMHLTQNQVRQLLPILQYFAEHGSLPSLKKAKTMSESVDLLEEE